MRNPPKLALAVCACLAGVLMSLAGYHSAAYADAGLSDIRVTQLHIFIVPAGDHLQVGEYYILSNTGSSTYTGTADSASGKQVTVAFTLPAGATNLQFSGPGLGERYLERPGGFADTQPIEPGESKAEVQYSYSLPYQDGMQLQRSFTIAVDSLALMITGEGLAIQGQGLTSLGSIDTQMGPALYYTGGPLAPDQPFTFSISGQAQAAATAPDVAAPVARNQGAETGFGMLALLAGGVGAAWLWRRRGSSLPPSGAQPLIGAIVALDEDFEAGRLPQDAYKRKRAGLFRQVRAQVAKGAK